MCVWVRYLVAGPQHRPHSRSDMIMIGTGCLLFYTLRDWAWPTSGLATPVAVWRMPTAVTSERGTRLRDSRSQESNPYTLDSDPRGLRGFGKVQSKTCRVPAVSDLGEQGTQARTEEGARANSNLHPLHRQPSRRAATPCHRPTALETHLRCVLWMKSSLTAAAQAKSKLARRDERHRRREVGTMGCNAPLPIRGHDPSFQTRRSTTETPDGKTDVGRNGPQPAEDGVSRPCCPAPYVSFFFSCCSHGLASLSVPSTARLAEAWLSAWLYRALLSKITRYCSNIVASRNIRTGIDTGLAWHGRRGNRYLPQLVLVFPPMGSRGGGKAIDGDFQNKSDQNKKKGRKKKVLPSISHDSSFEAIPVRQAPTQLDDVSESGLPAGASLADPQGCPHLHL